MPKARHIPRKANTANTGAALAGSPYPRPARFINPCTDFGFKRLFARDSTKDLLASFLNSILPAAYHVKTLKFLNTETFGINIKAKKFVYDILCKNLKGEKFIVEMQVEDQRDFEERSVAYLARAVSEQVPAGGDYKKLKAVCFIGLLKFRSRMKGLLRKPWQEVLLRNEEGGTFSEKLRMYFLQMPLFEKTEGELETKADKWFYFLKHLQDLANRPATFKEAFFEKAFNEAELLAMTPEERLNYDLELDSKRIAQSVQELREDNIRDAAKAELAAAKAQAKAELAAERTKAVAELAKVEAQAAAELAKVAAAKLNMARQMKRDGLRVEVIAKYTGLDPATLENL